MSQISFTHQLQTILDSLFILPRRLVLCTPGVDPTVPMLRGVWGKALHDLNEMVYKRVFNQGDEGGTPLYVLRPGGFEAGGFPVVEHILLGEAIRHEGVLLAAWIRACESGLGPDRVPFFLRGYALEPDGNRAPTDAPWPLGQAHWPLAGDPATTACELSFPWPVRLLSQGRLISEPTLPDLVVSLCRRVEGFLATDQIAPWRELSRYCLGLAREIPSSAWEGGPCDLVRWSARQQAEVQLRGVTGSLCLHEGPGPLWPLLAAGGWLHIGKGTVMGLGRVFVNPG